MREAISPFRHSNGFAAAFQPSGKKKISSDFTSGEKRAKVLPRRTDKRIVGERNKLQTTV
ncbi:MAG: hypothetical protein LBU39_09215 [Desulfobulbaceae bacterium]|jgi:hypothetical protein|nr:hypothetical protein [Desulfobulbaceae bacterium]